MTKKIIQYVEREISDLSSGSNRAYLQKLKVPKLIKYYGSEDGYSLHECWLIARIEQSQFHLCIIEGKLAGARHWGLLERRKNKYIFASHGVSTSLSSILDDVHYLLQEN